MNVTDKSAFIRINFSIFPDFRPFFRLFFAICPKNLDGIGLSFCYLNAYWGDKGCE